MAIPTNMPKLHTFQQFHPSFHTAPTSIKAPITLGHKHLVSAAPTTALISNWDDTPKCPGNSEYVAFVRPAVSETNTMPSNAPGSLTFRSIMVSM